MKFKKLLLLAFLFIFYAANAQQKNQASLPRPKLVVGLVVDQMRWDYLYRYYNRYSTDGFKRLMREGFACENTNIDYFPTKTAIGHSTIYTGSVPAIHGIAGNDFVVQATGKPMYCTEDTTVQTVGSTSEAGKMSPRNLLASTITDELKLATNFKSKVIGIALKDRGSILPAGHTPDAAYWFDNLSGNWISSTYYMKTLPAWVQKFNSNKLIEKYLLQDWKTLYPIATYIQSTADDVPYEEIFQGETTSAFPHKIPQIKGSDYNTIRNTPYGNTLTLDFAKEAIQSEKLGTGEATDFLAISLSSTDYIGHQFGPNSVEAEDTYLRLDLDLANFFNSLDKQIGKGNYTVFLTADHGAANNPQFLKDHHIPAGIWPQKQILKDLNSLLEAKYQVKNLAIAIMNYQLTLNNQLIADKKLDDFAIRKDCVDYIKTTPGVAYVIDMKNLASVNIPDEIRSRIIKGYSIERSGIIQVILQPGWYNGSLGLGTDHGAWNPYDTHIPLLWMGWGIKPGKTFRPVNMTDITPTLAALLSIQVPNGNIGQPITEVLK